MAVYVPTWSNKITCILKVYLFTPHFLVTPPLNMFGDPCVIFKLPEEKSPFLLLWSASRKTQSEFSEHYY